MEKLPLIDIWSEEELHLPLYPLTEQEEKRFVDITHDRIGKIGYMYYHPKTRKYSFEPIEN